MDLIWEKFTEWLKELLVGGIMDNLTGLFDNVNAKVAEAAGHIGSTPQAWNASIYSMIRSLSDNLILPIAGVILAFVMTLELIQLIADRNNLHDIDTWVFFRWVFKTAAAVLIVSNTWNIVMGVFEAAQSVVNRASGLIVGNTSINLADHIADLEARLLEMNVWTLLGLWLQSFVVGFTMWALTICIFIIIYGRMIEIYKVGIYCRLSVDDASNSAKAKNYIPADESVSSENQYELLSKFVMLNGWTEVKTYRDDGYSGGNFQRSGFLEMLEDARHGLINLILVKDLSRLGRDFVEVGRYTDVIFPSLGCRFVSVLDCLDTEGDNTDMLHFRSLMNDYHLKDLSNKVKSVLHAKMRSGQYIAAYAPYGYRKSEEDRHRLVIDEEAAAVVRRMFELRRGGMAYGKIAAVLNSEGILSPRWYWAKRYGNGSCKYANLWMYATVKNILTNEVYTGNLIQNQTGSRSYKDDTMIYKPESEWIRHEALHEAIISPEVWNEVQAINRERTRLSADNAPPKPFLFTGKLVCADCKAPLQGNRETQRRKNGTSKKYVSYFCSRYTASGYGACSRHTIYEMTLTELVLSEIRAHAEALELDEAAMLDRLQAQRTAADAERQESVRQEIGKLRRRVYELEQMTAKLYEDKVCGSISAASFAVLLEKTEQERRQRTDRLDTLLAEVREYEQSAADIQSWAAVVRKHLHIRELDRETVDELIDRIEVGEKTVIDGKNVRDIKIYYRFVGNI